MGSETQGVAMSHDYEAIAIDRTDSVATITLSRPEALNAITPQMLEELTDAFRRLGPDHGVKVIVLTGAGRAFSAGVDLKALGGRSLDGGKVGDLLDIPARRVIELISSVAAIVVAKVNGACFTGALELVLACDLVVAAEEALFGDTHAKFGLRPTWGMNQRLPHVVGPTRARELSYTARTFTGVEAATWGLATLSAPADRLDEVTAKLVARVVANSHGSLLAYKDLYRHGEGSSTADGLTYEATTQYPIDDTEGRIADFR